MTRLLSFWKNWLPILKDIWTFLMVWVQFSSWNGIENNSIIWRKTRPTNYTLNVNDSFNKSLNFLLICRQTHKLITQPDGKKRLYVFSNKIAVFFYCVVGTHFMVYVNIFRDLMVLIAAKFVMDQPAITEILPVR